MVCLLVCLSVTVVNCAKMAEPIEMPFGLMTRVDPMCHDIVLDGRSRCPIEVGNFEVKGRPIVT